MDMQLSIRHDHTLAALPTLGPNTQLYEFNCHEFSLLALPNRLNFYSDQERYNEAFVLQSRNPDDNPLFFKVYELDLRDLVYESAALLYDLELEGDLYRVFLMVNEKCVATYQPVRRRCALSAFSAAVPLHLALLRDNRVQVKFIMSDNSEDTDTVRLFYTAGYTAAKTTPASLQLLDPPLAFPVRDGRVQL